MKAREREREREMEPRFGIGSRLLLATLARNDDGEAISGIEADEIGVHQSSTLASLGLLEDGLLGRLMGESGGRKRWKRR